MRNMSRRAFLSAIGASAILISGCSQDDAPSNGSNAESESTVEEPKADKEPETAEVGEPIAVQTTNGDLNITVTGCEDSNYLTTSPALSNDVRAGKHIFVLTLIVENVSYEYPYADAWTENDVDINGIVILKDNSGAGLSIMSSSIDYSGLEIATGGYCTVPQGQSMNVGAFYQVDAGTQEVTVSVGNVDVVVPVTQGQ